MDRSWINTSRLSDEYEKGVEECLEFSKRSCPKNNEKFICPCVGCKFYCPCVNWLNNGKLVLKDIRDHLICDGFNKSYTRWIWHGESSIIPSASQREEVDVDMDDQLEEMIRDLGHESFRQTCMYDTLCSDNAKPLYLGCTDFTRLSAVLKLVNLKPRNGWIDTSFTELLALLKDMLPKDTLPDRNYEAKKILCPMGMECKKYMHVLNIAYCTGKNLKINMHVLLVGHHATK